MVKKNRDPRDLFLENALPLPLQHLVALIVMAKVLQGGGTAAYRELLVALYRSRGIRGPQDFPIVAFDDPELEAFLKRYAAHQEAHTASADESEAAMSRPTWEEFSRQEDPQNEHGETGDAGLVS